jgi:hypothetical protein
MARCIVTSLQEQYSIRKRLNLRKVVIIVALLNLAYFGVEFAIALAIGSVSLLADSIDFLEDALINSLIAIALGWSATSRARIGMALAGILLIPGLATLWMAWQKIRGSNATCVCSLVTRWSWRLSNQPTMRAHAGAFPYAQRGALRGRHFSQPEMMLWQTSRLSGQDLLQLTPFPHGPILSWEYASRR